MSGIGMPKGPRLIGKGLPGCGPHPGAPAGGPAGEPGGGPGGGPAGEPGGGPGGGPAGGPPGCAGLAGVPQLGEPCPGDGGLAGVPQLGEPWPGGGGGGSVAISRYSVAWWTYIDWMPIRPGPVIRTMCSPAPPKSPVESFWLSTVICTDESL